MNRISRFASLMLIVIVPFTYIACGGDGAEPEPEPTQKEKVTTLLSANGAAWSPQASSGITVDGVDVTEDLFSGFTIKFGNGTLTTTGTSPVWLRNDTWTFTDDTATKIKRGQDNKEITISNISETELKLTLQWDETTYEGGRKKSIPGVYTFTLKK